MSWSYVDPNKFPKDAVRLEIGDTDSTDPLLQDFEIQYFLLQYNNSVLSAAIRACEVIMSKFTRLADEQVGSVNIKFSQKSKQYGLLVIQLRQRLAIDGDIIPYAGGISKMDKDLQNQNQDRVRPDFTKRMEENRSIAPRTSSEGDLSDRLLADDNE